MACTRGNLDIIKYLVEHGANIDAKDGDAIIRASINNYLDIVKYLVSCGCNNCDKALLQSGRMVI